MIDEIVMITTKIVYVSESDGDDDDENIGIDEDRDPKSMNWTRYELKLTKKYD